MTGSQRAAADPHASAFVRANAGSGKTKTLIDRTARLLLAGAEPAQILCVTYTRAAAAEMQRRLFNKLGEWSVMDDAALRKDLIELTDEPEVRFDKPYLETARTLFARALETPGGLKIQTIHGFCERLLRRFPLEAGVSTAFEVVDDASAAALAASARAGVAGRVLAAENQTISDAYARMSVALDFQAFQKMFAAFEAERSGIRDWLARIGGLKGLPEAVRIACGLEQLAEAAEVEAAAVLPPQLDPAAWFAAARALAQGTGRSDPLNGIKYQQVAEAALRGEALPEVVRGLFVTGTGGLRASLATKSVDEAVRGWLGEEQARVCAAFEEARAQRIAQDTLWAMTLAFVYLQEYEAAKKARGVLDFADLVEKTRALLSEGPAAAWVLYKLDDGIDHILVDEAQDTAPDQWEILRNLTGEFFSGEARPSNRTPERSLFVVGDKKQSIYSFQGAQPERLDLEIEFHRGRIEGAGLRAETVALEQSWRSTPEVLRFVDAMFEPAELSQAIQPGADAVRHEAGRADGPGCIDLWAPVEDVKGEDRSAWDAPVDAEGEASANVKLARRIADEIKALVARGDGVCEDRKWRPAGYGDVLILVRRRGALFEDILRALKQAEVPVAGADRLALSAHIAFDDLLALARFALFPEDELTLAALLKSPFCALDDDDLFRLGFGRRRENLWAVLQRRAHENAGWARALGFLSGVLSEGRRRRPFDFYARILAGADEGGLSRRQQLLARLGAEAADAIDEFLAQVLAAEGRGARDLESLAHALGGLDIIVKRDMDEGAGQVRVMTTHGAKGLEAPIVILPEMTWNQRLGAGPLLKTEDGGYLWCTSKTADCLASTGARNAAVARLEDEQLRLLYVGVTRARDRLILCGRVAADTKPEKYGRWYLAAQQALEGLGAGGGEVRVLEDEQRVRFGADPVRLAARAASLPDAVAPPPWLGAGPKAEPDGVRFVSPSALGESAKSPAISPLARAGGLGRFRRGSLIHKLLQILPDLPAEGREAAAGKLLAREPDLSDGQRAEMAGAAMGVLNDPVFAGVFGPGSRAEASIAGAAKDLPPGVAISGQVDRLVVGEGRVLVADFKTNRPAPARIEDADPAYILQMAAYVAALREAFPGRAVEAALIWTDGPALMPVPEFLILRALAELGRTS